MLLFFNKCNITLTKEINDKCTTNYYHLFQIFGCNILLLIVVSELQNFSLVRVQMIQKQDHWICNSCMYSFNDNDNII